MSEDGESLPANAKVYLVNRPFGGIHDPKDFDNAIMACDDLTFKQALEYREYRRRHLEALKLQNYKVQVGEDEVITIIDNDVVREKNRPPNRRSQPRGLSQLS
jgi:hypothetical protein